MAILMSPLDYAVENEKLAKVAISKGAFDQAKKYLDEALKTLKSSEPSEFEFTDLLVILKKILNGYITIKDFPNAIETLNFIHSITRGRISLINDVKNLLKNIPQNFNILPYEENLRKLVGNNSELVDLLNILVENSKKLGQGQ
ncbi:MAG: hypothetical protein ACP5JT_00530 [Thermoplasmata archaeon]